MKKGDKRGVKTSRYEGGEREEKEARKEEAKSMGHERRSEGGRKEHGVRGDEG